MEPGERFCGDCGAALAAKTSKTSTSPAPPSSSFAAKTVERERKQLTVLFADVQGSMDLQEDLDPEAWAAIVGRFVEILAAGVRRFGGTVDKFTGDGIMALFGAPAAQEDHALRACHAASHLTKAVGAYAEELRRSHNVDLHVRLGLNSGEVVVGRVGDDLRLDPTALGHTVGVAQRMEAMAEPGRAYLTEHTARLVGGWFRLKDLGPMAVKGVRAPLGVYVLEQPAPSPPFVRGGRALGSSPLVGRERELAVLEDALAAAEEGRAQVVGVVGEAGVGKSRLCEEFAASAVARGITVRRTAGVSHAREVPLLPILSLMRDYFGITEADSSGQAREKVAAYLLALDPGLEEALPLLFDFLEVADPERPAPNLVSEVRMRRIFEALRRVTQRRSEREVLLLVVEDLQWFDPQSEVFLERVIESYPGSRTLVVANFRPEFSAGWMRHSYYRQLPVAPLRDEAVDELLGGLLGADLSLTPLLGFVLERTAGNPFFVEEVLRALVEDGTLAGNRGSYRLTRPLQDVLVPPSVQAVLAARIDRLFAEHKVVLQTASVIGRTFGEAVLAIVTGLGDEALEDALRALCAAELLQQAGGHPTTEYRFWHPLTQEVAYDTLLAGRRCRLHRAVALAIIDIESRRLEERSALVASHFERAGDNLEAARWNARSASWASRTDLNEAVRRWRAVLAHLSDVPESEETLSLGIAARFRLLQLWARTGIADEEAETVFAEGRSAAEKLGDIGQLAGLTQFHGSLQLFRGDVREGLASWLEAARLADRTGDVVLQASKLYGPPYAYAYAGPLAEGLRLIDKAIAMCEGDQERGSHHVGYSPLARALLFRALLLALAGRLEEAREDLEHGLSMARQRSESETVLIGLSIYPRLDLYAGEGQGSLDPAKEALRIADDSGNHGYRVIALQALGMAELAAGRREEAAVALDRGLGEARTHRAGRFEEASILSYLALAHLGVGDGDRARQLAEEAREVAKRQGARVLECLALLTWAQVLRVTGGSRDAVLAALDVALPLANEIGAFTYEPFIWEELGHLKANKKDFEKALGLFRTIGATGQARRLEADIADPAKPAGVPLREGG